MPAIDWGRAHYSAAFWVLFGIAPVAVGLICGIFHASYLRRLAEGALIGIGVGVLANPLNWLALLSVTPELWQRIWDAPGLVKALPSLLVLTLPGLILSVGGTVLACLWLDSRRQRLARA